jgi:rhodanese-related sulfurtransferase
MVKNLSVQEVFEMIKGATAYGIDVRETNEWSAGRAVGVTWNPLSNFSLENLPTDKPLIFICRSGNRSGSVCEALEPTRTDVYNMVGGMQAWHTSGLPMVGDLGDPKVA